jgi:hypothetical protein
MTFLSILFSKIPCHVGRQGFVCIEMLPEQNPFVNYCLLQNKNADFCIRATTFEDYCTLSSKSRL